MSIMTSMLKGTTSRKTKLNSIEVVAWGIVIIVLCQVSE